MHLKIATLCLAVLFIALFLLTSTLNALDQMVVFEDDFSSGSMENWILSLGEWDVESNAFCTVTCGT